MNTQNHLFKSCFGTHIGTNVIIDVQKKIITNCDYAVENSIVFGYLIKTYTKRNKKEVAFIFIFPTLSLAIEFLFFCFFLSLFYVYSFRRFKCNRHWCDKGVPKIQKQSRVFWIHSQKKSCFIRQFISISCRSYFFLLKNFQALSHQRTMWFVIISRESKSNN